jgi:hypothetical protein
MTGSAAQTIAGDLTVSGTLTNGAYTQTATNIDAGASGTAGTIDIFPATAAKGKVQFTKADNTNNDTTTVAIGAHGQATTVNLSDMGLAATYLVQSTLPLTAAEVNQLDQSASLQSVTGAVAITADGTKNRASLDSGGAYAITLAAPGAAAVGRFLCIEYSQGGTDAVTLALTNVTGGTAGTSASFNADGEGLLLFGAETKWVVIKEFGGVTLS